LGIVKPGRAQREEAGVRYPGLRLLRETLSSSIFGVAEPMTRKEAVDQAAEAAHGVL